MMASEQDHPTWDNTLPLMLPRNHICAIGEARHFKYRVLIDRGVLVHA